MINGLDLFSGIGGLTLALSEWVYPVAYCEIDRYAQSVLLSRMANGRIPRSPIWDDVASLSGTMLPKLDIIYGGFPCQDISAAGAGIGLGGERSGLFQHIARLVSETNPRFVFLENVPAIRTRGLNCVAQTFTELGYDCRWTIVSAAEVGHPKIEGKRWFMLAKAPVNGLERLELQKMPRAEPTKATNFSLEAPRWLSDCPGLRMGDELPRPMDEIRALGNGVDWFQAQTAFKRLMGLE